MQVDTKNLESLQAYAYRILVSIEGAQKELQAVNQLIANFKPEAVEESEALAETPEVEAEKVEDNQTNEQ